MVSIYIYIYIFFQEVILLLDNDWLLDGSDDVACMVGIWYAEKEGFEVRVIVVDRVGIIVGVIDGNLVGAIDGVFGIRLCVGVNDGISDGAILSLLDGSWDGKGWWLRSGNK